MDFTFTETARRRDGVDDASVATSVVRVHCDGGWLGRVHARFICSTSKVKIGERDASSTTPSSGRWMTLPSQRLSWKAGELRGAETMSKADFAKALSAPRCRRARTSGAPDRVESVGGAWA